MRLGRMGDNTPLDRTRAVQSGYQAHLAKPVEPAERVATIGSFANLIDARRRPASR